MKLRSYFLLSFAIVCVDQLTKLAVKTRMNLGEEVEVLGKGFSILFAENDGFAFGLTLNKVFGLVGLSLSPVAGKLLLTFFSFLALMGLVLVLYYYARHQSYLPLFIASILGGAMGNMIDRTFYGVWFDPINTYAGGMFQGRVVDMFTVDLGLFGGPSPIFNLADVAIFVGILAILFFQGKFMRQHKERTQLPAEQEMPSPAPDSSLTA
ncbi:MAG: signal peptidase II [Bacteroidota bacterium]